jgi:hypothetical protein
LTRPQFFFAPIRRRRAFYSIDDVQAATEGVFPQARRPRGLIPGPIRLQRAA